MIRFSAFPAVALVLGVTVAPLVFLLRVSLYQSGGERGFYTTGTFTLSNFAALAEAPIQFTLVLAFAVALIGTLLGLGLALFIESLTPRRQSLALALLIAPKLAGALTLVFGLQRLLPRGCFASLIAEVSFALPYIVLVLLTKLRGLAPELLSVSRGLGANCWQTFRRVTFPLILPSTILAFQLSLAWGLGAFVGPLFLAGPAQSTLATQIQDHVAELRWPVAAAEGVLLLLLTAMVYAVPRPRGHE